VANPPPRSQARAPARATLVRPRLVARLAARFTTPVTVVAAPAGFGKTTLLDQALDGNRLAPQGLDAPVTCTAEHVAASALAEDLLRALGAPSEGQGTVGQLVDAVWHRSPEPVALVLDDVHEIPAGSPGARALRQLIDRLPGNGHVVLSGREPLPVPLARLEVAGHLHALGPDDLALTAAELEALADRRGVPVGQLAACAGWPALAELAAAAPRRTQVEAEYLWEEVLAAIEPARRRDLALLAHIGPFDEAIAIAALDRPDVDLTAVVADLPLVGRAGGRRTIHSLWQPHLARCVDAADIAGARRRVGNRLAVMGEVSAAVRMLGQAGAWDDLTQVVLGALGASHPPVPADVVAVWLDGLPAERREGGLGRLLAATARYELDPPAAARLLTDAAEAFRQDGEVAGEMAALAQLALAAWWREDGEVMATVVGRVLELEGDGVAEAVPLACLARALVRDVANECDAALDELDRIPPGSFSGVWASLVDWLRSLWLHHLGYPADALVLAERAAKGAGPFLGPLVEAARLQATWFLGRCDEMLAGVPAVVDAVEDAGLRDYTALMATQASSVHAFAGRLGEATRYLARARAARATSRIPLVEVNLAIAEAALAVGNGDEDEAARILARYFDRSGLLVAGHAAAPQQRSLALWYVLLPETRAVWDASELGPCVAAARDLARAVVAGREGSRQATPDELPPPALARPLLPLRWLVELGLGHLRADHAAGWDMFEVVWPAAHPVVRTHARRPGPWQRPARAVLARLPVPPAGRLDLRLLGPTELRRDGEPVDAPEWRRERVRSLLAHLVLHRPDSRERLADDLWGTLDADAQSRNLRVTLTYLLRVLEPHRAERDASFLVAPHGGGLLLHRGDWLTTDVWRFDDLADRALDADRQGLPAVALDLMREAVDLWRDQPTDLLDDWARPHVEERAHRLVTLAVRAGELLLARGEPAEAVRLAEAAIRIDPWSDRGHAAAVAAHLAAGDLGAAHRAADRYGDLLGELGVDAGTRARLLDQLEAS
jgi:LuxR family maltose regulon positive regulatory protein